MLWDLTQVIQTLNRPGLKDLVKTSPLDAIWVYQKVPLIPQLLAHFLRSLGGDGIVFPSTKHPGSQNFAFFFKSDVDSMAAFNARKLN